MAREDLIKALEADLKGRHWHALSPREKLIVNAIFTYAEALIHALAKRIDPRVFIEGGEDGG